MLQVDRFGVRTAPALVKVESPAGRGAWVRVVMGEGRKREIREVATRLGLRVVRLQRIRIGSLLLGTLRPGQARDLSSAEVRALSVSARAPRAPRGPRPVKRSPRKASTAAAPRRSAPGRGPLRRATAARPRTRRGHRE
jgi:23S rRNA pseudouridine2605 synthase